MKRQAMLIALYILAPLLSLFIGSWRIPPDKVLLSLICPGSSMIDFVIWKIRLPRIILAFVTGAILSVSGASLQSLFRNPLVDSYILGISSGAAFGAAVAILFIPGGFAIVALTAFIFSMVAFAFTYTMASIRGEHDTLTLVLAGIIVSAIFSSLLSLLKFIAEPEKLAAIVYWLMGSFSGTRWSTLIAVPLAMASITLLWLMRWRINVLSLPEDEAKSLGVNVGLERTIILILIALGVSSVTAVTGIIGWVGLLTPHLIRMAFKTMDNMVVITHSIFLGGAYMVLVDDVARALTSMELPLTMITTLMIAPFFLYLLKRGAYKWL